LLKGYIASPLGFNEAGRVYYEGTYLRALASVLEVIDPWAQVHPDEADRAVAEGRSRDLWLAVGAENLRLIASSDVVVAWLDGQEVDSGTAIEIGYAAALSIPCFAVRSDLRQAGEIGMAVNLQVEATIAATGGSVSRSLSDLLAELRAHTANSEKNRA
jgi:nucleoside 2-deoxyribosyltransferase